MTPTSPEQNKALIIQHRSHIEPGRDGLFDLARALPDPLRYEHAVIVAEGDYVLLHERFSGHGQPAALRAADMVRIETAVSPSIGMSCRTKQPKPNRRAGCRCSATVFLPDHQH